MVLAPFVNYNMGAKIPFTAEAAHYGYRFFLMLGTLVASYGVFREE